MGRFFIEIWPRSELAAKKREDYFRELKHKVENPIFMRLRDRGHRMTDDK